MKNFKIIYLDEVSSTNIYASDLLSEKKIECNTVVTAKFQKSGKGQGVNKWVSERGKNLLLSIVICPNFVKAGEQFRISKIVSISLRETLNDLGISAVIKWPNDILAGQKKIAGILIENSLQSDKINSSIVGIGLNVNQEEFDDMPVKATSVLLETSDAQEVQQILTLLLDKFELWYSMLEAGDINAIDKEYLKYLYGLNVFLPFRKGNALFEAMITGVDETGELFLRRKDGKILKVVFKEIEYM